MRFASLLGVEASWPPPGTPPLRVQSAAVRYPPAGNPGAWLVTEGRGERLGLPREAGGPAASPASPSHPAPGTGSAGRGPPSIFCEAGRKAAGWLLTTGWVETSW